MVSFLLQHESESRPALIVEIADDALMAVPAVKRRMLMSGCAHAMVIDERDVLILRDTFLQSDESSIVVEHQFPTDRLATGVGSLVVRVRRWLERMSSNWHAVLPTDEEWAPPLLYDIVPALSGSSIEEFDAA